MGIVTLTGHLGSMGDIGTLVSRQLGYKLLGRELVAEAAASLGWESAQAAEFDERTGGLGRWIRNLFEHYAFQQATEMDLVAAYGMTYADAAGAAGPEGDRYIEALRQVMTAFAKEGDVVLVGRGGQALFANEPGATHIRVACDTDERARRIARRDEVSVEEARATVDESDKQREAWHSKYFGIDYQSPYQYHLVVNSGLLTEPLAAQLICEVAQQQITHSKL